MSIDSTKCTKQTPSKNEESIVYSTSISSNLLNSFEDEYEPFKSGEKVGFRGSDKISPIKHIETKKRIEKTKSPGIKLRK